MAKGIEQNSEVNRRQMAEFVECGRLTEKR
jgi:hypothetical protein